MAEKDRKGRRRVLGALALLGLAGLAVFASRWLRRWRDREQEQRLRAVHTLSGAVEVHPEFRSSLLGAARRVWVYLPPGYETQRDRRFPVLYMQDGQNVFDGATAFVAGREWQLDEAAERLVRDDEIEPPIVVAVDNAGGRRAVEYTPVPDASAPEGGGADLYGRMLIEELKPWVDRSYRTQPEPEATAIGGSSLGALASFYLGLGHPEVFGRVAALSLSAWWGDRYAVRFVDGLRSKPPARIWLDVGTREGDHAVPSVRSVRDALVRKGWREGVDLRYVEVPGARHDEAAWSKRVPDVLRFLFPPPRR